MFKPGDIVELVRDGKMGWEVWEYWKVVGLKIGECYKVSDTNSNGDISLEGDPYEGYLYWHHPDHFKLAEIEVGDEVEIIETHYTRNNKQQPVGRRFKIKNIEKGTDGECFIYYFHKGKNYSCGLTDIKLIKKGVKKMCDKEFKVGDRIKILKDGLECADVKKGDILKIVKVIDEGKTIVAEDRDGKEWNFSLNSKEIERVNPMSKYNDLKQRIEQVEGWTKDADDILQEIGVVQGVYHSIQIDTIQTETNHPFQKVVIRVGTEGSIKAEFNYTNQCSKLRAFKDALLWLLEHSNIKKDTFPEGDVEVEGTLTIGGVSKQVKIKGTITQRD